MHPYVINQLAEDRRQQLHSLARPRRQRTRRSMTEVVRAARANLGSLLIAWGAALLSPPEAI